MKKEFWERVKWEIIVDTRKYRYVLDDDISLERPLIKRLPIEDLDTTAAIDGWEVVIEQKRLVWIVASLFMVVQTSCIATNAQKKENLM